MRMYSNKKRGITFVELMIVIVIIIILASIVNFFFQRTLRSFHQGQYKYIVDSEAQLLIENLKRDLAMSCKLENGTDYLLEPIFHFDTAKNEWSWYRFDEYENGEPKAKSIKYTFDEDKLTVKREFEGSKPRVWEGVEFFKLHYYGLLPQHRYFYNIQLEIKIGKDIASKKSETLRLTTSVESKYENHLVNFPGWMKNESSTITDE